MTVVCHILKKERNKEAKKERRRRRNPKAVKNKEMTNKEKINILNMI